jgi:hypothetical protein
MAYAGDLKSLALRGVRVRLPPRAPGISNLYLAAYVERQRWLMAPSNRRQAVELVMKE